MSFSRRKKKLSSPNFAKWPLLSLLYAFRKGNNPISLIVIFVLREAGGDSKF